MQKGIDFRLDPKFRGAVLAPLRALLCRLGVPVWAEITVGNSYLAYRGLDAYIRVFGAGIESATQEAHFLLNTERMPSERRLLAPELWWLCSSWVSLGQKDVVAEWNLELLASLVSANNPTSRRRMDAILQHLRSTS